MSLSFAETLEQADDMAIDIPHIWLYLAELLSPVLKGGGFSMRELFRCSTLIPSQIPTPPFAGPGPSGTLTGCLCLFVRSELRKPLLPVGRAGTLISEILHILCKQMVSRTFLSSFLYCRGDVFPEAPFSPLHWEVGR